MFMVPDYLLGSKVLIVDDNSGNLKILEKVLKDEGLDPIPVSSGRLALSWALKETPNLVLLDMNMPEMSGLEVCQWFKLNKNLQNIPILFISGDQDIDVKVEAFHAGGVDYISKPFHKEEVMARVITHLSMRRLQAQMESHTLDLERRVAEQVDLIMASNLSTIFAIAKLAEIRDDDTGKHVERVQTFARMLAEQLRDNGSHLDRLTDIYIDTLYQTASLHDIGKVGIADAILLKPGRLTSEEFKVMKTHSVIGARTLDAVLKQHPDNRFLRMGVDVARAHHERWDGSGYPDNLKGEAIPLAGRIVAVADFYDALRSTRCYHLPLNHEDTRDLIREGRGAHFDPDIADAFIALEEPFRRVRREMGE
jgi:putative two-component system response regulator